MASSKDVYNCCRAHIHTTGNLYISLRSPVTFPSCILLAYNADQDRIQEVFLLPTLWQHYRSLRVRCIPAALHITTRYDRFYLRASHWDGTSHEPNQTYPTCTLDELSASCLTT